MGRGGVPGWMEKKTDFEGRDLVACKTEKKITIDCLGFSAGTFLIARQLHCLETT